MIQVYKLIVRTIATRGRIAFVALLGCILIVFGILAGATDEANVRRDVLRAIADTFALPLLAPGAALAFASASLGDTVDDETLVYLWLRPIARWKLAAAALAATLTITLPLVVVPAVAGLVIGGADGDYVGGAAASLALAATAYSALFVGLGLYVKRALLWGLLYVFLWEATIASFGTGLSRISIRGYARSVLNEMSGLPGTPLDVPLAAGIIVPAAIAVVAFVLTIDRLRRMSVA